MPELETAVAAAEPAAAKKATKKRAVVYGVFSVLLVLGVLAGIAAAILQTRNTNKLLKTAMRQNESMQAALEAALKQSDESGEDLEEAEDDVVIMDEYTIRSTTQISDAYISGDTSALSDRDKETLEMAKDVLDSVITDDMSDYDKEKAIYTWLTTKLTANTGLLTVIPNTDDDADNPYGVLKNRNPVCVGYATTFRLFMQMLGIECKVVHNLDRYHSWDLVKLDGDWYHVDCYMGSDSGSMASFNMDDNTAANDHDWNTSFFPAARGTRYSPAMMNRKTVEDLYALPALIRDALDAREDCFSCSFDKPIDSSTEQAAAAMTDRLNQAVWNVEGEELNDFRLTWALDEEGAYVLQCFITYTGDQNNDELDEETSEKINEAIYEVFNWNDFEEYDDSGEDMNAGAEYDGEEGVG